MTSRSLQSRSFALREKVHKFADQVSFKLDRSVADELYAACDAIDRFGGDLDRFEAAKREQKKVT